jgi:flagellar protein FliS
MTNPRSSYREADVRGASAVRLVVLLYEQVIHDLRKAIEAIEQNDIELRGNSVNHAISVIAHLQGNLNMKAGGQVALNLEHFYRCLGQNLVQAHFHSSRPVLLQQITDLMALREAWIEVDRSEVTLAAAQAVPLRKARHSDATAHTRSDWNG